jgi:hypothetical protein
MAKEVLDLATLDMVPVEEPKEKAETTSKKPAETEEEESEEEEEEEVEKPKPEAKKKKTPEEEFESDEEEEGEKEEEESEEEEKEEESEEESEEEDEKEETTDKKKKEEKEEEVDIDEVIKSTLEEKYGIENQEQLTEVLDQLDTVSLENEELKEKLKVAEEGKPKFKSKTQEKIYDFLKDYDPEKLPDGLITYATIVGMDVEKMDPKLLMEQAFIIEHPNMQIDRARAKFNRDWEKKYVIDEESFDGDAKQLKEKKDDIQDDIEIEADKARKLLKKKQVELKVESENKTTEEEPKVSPEVQSEIKENMKSFLNHFKETHTLTFQPDENDEFKVNYKFSKEELAAIKSLIENNISNPAHYDKKGKMIGGFDPEEKFIQAAGMIAFRPIVKELLKSAKTRSHIIKASEISKQKPIRKAKSAGTVEESFMSSAEKLAEKKRKERGGY